MSEKQALPKISSQKHTIQLSQSVDGDDEYEQDFEKDEGVKKIPKPKSRSYSSRREIEIKNHNPVAKHIANKKEANET